MVRLVPRKRWNADKIGDISALPMDFKTKNLDIIEQSQEPQAHARSEQEVEDVDVSGPKGRRMQVGWKQLQDYGYSDGCSRCSLHRQGLHQRAKQHRHSESCRSRIYRAMRDALGELPPEESRRPEIKTKNNEEPKDAPPDPPKPLVTPEPPRMDQPAEDSAHDIEDEHMDSNNPEDIPDIGDEGMIEDTTDAYA